MKVFISWSGEFSRRVAECLGSWIQIIIQTVDVFCSPEDIEKGENWNSRLSEELEESNFGIVCLTPQNVEAPWIHFEAGALSKTANSRVSSIMLGVTPLDIKGPLSQLQNTACTRKDFFRLFQSINKASNNPLKPEILKNAFDHSWEDLIKDISSIVSEYSPHTSPPNAEESTHEKCNIDSDTLQEVLSLVRNLDTKLGVLSENLTASSGSDCKKSSNIQNEYVVFAFLSCPEECVDRALPIIRKYIRDPTDIDDIGRILRARHTCPVSVSGYKFDIFSSELRQVSYKIKIAP